MSVVRAALSCSAGILAGLVVGYALWGQPLAELERALSKARAELAQTKTWLWDEIRTSDERHERVSASLTQTLADLSKARAELARLRSASAARAEAASPSLPADGGSRPPGITSAASSRGN